METTIRKKDPFITEFSREVSCVVYKAYALFVIDEVRHIYHVTDDTSQEFYPWRCYFNPITAA